MGNFVSDPTTKIPELIPATEYRQLIEAVHDLRDYVLTLGSSGDLVAACYVHHTAQYNIGNETILLYDQLVYDTHEAVATPSADWAFVVPEGQGGLYQVSHVTSVVGTAANWPIRIRLFKNDAAVYHMGTLQNTASLNAYTLAGCVELSLAAGDSINLRGYDSNGGTVIQGDDNSFICIRRVGDSP